MFDSCQNRRQCQVMASTNTFRQDPCPKTSKYLKVSYKCNPSKYIAQRFLIHVLYFGNPMLYNYYVQEYQNTPVHLHSYVANWICTLLFQLPFRSNLYFSCNINIWKIMIWTYVYTCILMGHITLKTIYILFPLL